jgi:hypothetical protein
MSPQPHAESLLNQLFQRRRNLENSFQSSFLLDEVEARRLAKTLQAESAKGSITQMERGAILHELAYVEGLRGRLTSALGFMGRALHCGLDQLAIAVSKAHILTMFGRFIDARAELETIDLENLRASAQGSVLGLCEEVGMYTTATKLGAGKDGPEVFSAEVSKMLAAADINEIEVTQRLDYAASIVNMHALHRLIAYDLFAMDGEGILFRFVIDGSMDELLALDWSISAQVAKKFQGPLDDILSIGIKPFSKGEQHLEYGAYRVDI